LTPVAKSALFEWDFEREALHLCDANPSAAQRFVEAVDAAVEFWRSTLRLAPSGVTEIRTTRPDTCSCLAFTTT
jgi:plasmid stabilization system protein ParE